MNDYKVPSYFNFSIVAFSAFLLVVPLINFFLILDSGENGFIGEAGYLTPKGVGAICIIVLLVLTALLLHSKYQKLFRLVITVLFVSVPTAFVYMGHSDIVTKLGLILVSLFYLFYFLNYEKSGDDTFVQVSQAILLHIGFILAMITISTRSELLDIQWTRFSLFAHFVGCFAFMTFFQKRISKKSSPWKMIFSFFLSIIAFVGYLVNNDKFYGLVFILAIFWTFLLLNEIRYDTFLINLLFDNPYKLLIGSFLAIVFLGSLLLAMPFSSASGVGISYIDSLFTATSAVCVTGLVVLDTYRDFSYIGQGVILVLIQIGGLGIITIMTFLSVSLGQSIGIGREYVVGEIIGSQRPKFFYNLIRLIVIATIIIESMGALILTFSFIAQGTPRDLAIWKGIFHAISAFCNAGFALQSDSLVSYQSSYIIPVMIAILIITGGIGFPVISYLKDALLRKTVSKRMPLSIKLTLLITGLLLVLGYIVFLIGEYNHALIGLSPAQKHVNAFFQSVTARTAGFNMLQLNQLTDFSILMMLILMFIGAGSCSTAGGIKVTTIGLLLAVVISHIKGSPKPTLFQKEIPLNTVIRAIILVMTSFMLICFIAFILLLNQELSLKETLFEIVSAFGTVGLSLGTTAKLDSFGKLLVLIVMFIGRVNILTFIALFTRKRKSRVKYPEEQIMIG